MTGVVIIARLSDAKMTTLTREALLKGMAQYGSSPLLTEGEGSVRLTSLY